MRTVSRWQVIARNKTGCALVVVNAICGSLLFAQKPRVPDAHVAWLDEAELFEYQGCAGQILVAGRAVHLFYESPSMKRFVQLNLPSYIVGVIVSAPLVFLGQGLIGSLATSWFVAVVFLGVSSLQWWLVGLFPGWLWTRTTAKAT
jgi:hypothetical protein